jgi:hypothetical protein
MLNYIALEIAAVKTSADPNWGLNADFNKNWRLNAKFGAIYELLLVPKGSHLWRLGLINLKSNDLNQQFVNVGFLH